MRISVPVPVEVTRLTHALLAAGLPVTGVTDLGDAVDIPGTFTAAQETQLRALVAAHDGPAARATREARRQAQQAAQRQHPGTLTLPQRVERLERILGLEGD